MNDSEDATKPSSGSEPKGAERNRDKQTGNHPPSNGEKGEPPRNEEPAWFAMLPEEYRSAALSGDTDKIPKRWADWVKWMRDHASEPRR